MFWTSPQDPDGRTVAATVQPGPCCEGPQHVLIAWSDGSAVVHQDDLVTDLMGELKASFDRIRDTTDTVIS